MSTNDNAYEIERFGDRVRWMGRHLKKTDKVRRPADDTANIYECIIDLRIQEDPNRKDQAAREFASKKTWDRCIAGNYRIKHKIVRGLLDVFPELTEDMVTCPSYEEFERKTTLLLSTHARWTRAIECMAKERDTLAQIAKRYYDAAGIDNDNTSPLITHKQWVIPRPIEMSQTSPVSTFKFGAPAPATANLDSLNLSYVELKSRNNVRRPFNGDCYRLMSIRRVGDNIEFDFQNTQYFDYVNTCEILGVELADQYIAHQSSTDGKAGTSWVPTQSQLARRGPAASAFDFGNRAAFVGVNCLLMIRNYSTGQDGRKSHKFYFHDRGESTLEAQNTLHVVPAGGHQPLEEAFGNKLDVSLWRTAVREFCEELFDKKEMTHSKADGGDFLERNEVKAQLKAFIFSGAARFFFMGVGLDPVTTKPEVLVAIVVDWPKAQMAGGKEALAIKSNYEGSARPMDLTRAALQEFLDHPHPPKPWLPAGRACIELALRHYDFLMGEDA